MHNPRHIRTLLLAMLATAGTTLFVSACDGGSGATGPAGPPAAVLAAGGDGQSGAVAEQLLQPVTARVEDADGNPVEGVEVRWRVTSGGGTITSTSTTRPSGQAQAVWTLGTDAGEQTAEAAVQGAGTAAFTATAEPGPAAVLVPSDDVIGFEALGETYTLTATAADEYGNAIDASAVTWSSDDWAVVTVDLDGVVTAEGNGITSVTASNGDLTAAVDVIVQQVAVTLELAAAQDSLHTIGATVEVAVDAQDGNGNALPAELTDWASLDPAVATVDDGGVVTAAGPGTARIVGSSGSVADTVEVVVDPTATALEITTGALLLTALEDTAVAVAQAADASGTPFTVQPSWAVESTTVASVSTDGVVTALGNGTTLLIATYEDLADTTEVTVQQVVAGASVLPESPDTLTAIEASLVLEADGLDANGFAVPSATAAWASLDVATALVDTAGTVTAQANGEARIVATIEGFSDTVTVHVRQVAAVVALTADTQRINAIGDTILIAATAEDANGFPVPDSVLTWTSTDAAVAAAVAEGGAVAVANGEAAIIAASGVAADTAAVVVHQVVAAITIPNDTIVAGDTVGLELIVEATDSNGVAVPPSFLSWSTSNAAALEVDTDAIVGVGPGASFVTAEADGVSGDGAFIVGWNYEGVDAGYYHACARGGSGAAYCWGVGEKGRLGYGSYHDKAMPSAVASTEAWADIAAGQTHTCGVTADGSLYCWGDGLNGKIGDGATAERWQPVAVGVANNWADVDAGANHTCALDLGGTIFCWGYNLQGQLGDGTNAEQHMPVQVTGSRIWTQVTTGDLHTCGLTDAGEAYCWGSNIYKQLGTEVSLNATYQPILVAGDHEWADLSAGALHTCGVTTAGDAYCWGANHYGQLGDNSLQQSNVPVPVFGTQVWADIDAGANYTCGITDEGVGYCWGRGYEWQLGSATTASRRVPDLIRGDHAWVEIATGFEQTCGITQDRLTFCWGTGDIFGASRAYIGIEPVLLYQK